jgi:hypothetical protein
MCLTHFDENGDDSPAILIDNTTAANRAVNLPEFVSAGPDGIRSIGGPKIEFFRQFGAGSQARELRARNRSPGRQ